MRAVRPVLRWFRDALTAAGWLWMYVPPRPPEAPPQILAAGPVLLVAPRCSGDHPPLPAGTGPAPGHPERLCPDVPLSPQERLLQRQLGF